MNRFDYDAPHLHVKDLKASELKLKTFWLVDLFKVWNQIRWPTKIFFRQLVLGFAAGTKYKFWRLNAAELLTLDAHNINNQNRQIKCSDARGEKKTLMTMNSAYEGGDKKQQKKQTNPNTSSFMIKLHTLMNRYIFF